MADNDYAAMTGAGVPQLVGTATTAPPDLSYLMQQPAPIQAPPSAPGQPQFDTVGSYFDALKRGGYNPDEVAAQVSKLRDQIEGYNKKTDADYIPSILGGKQHQGGWGKAGSVIGTLFNLISNPIGFAAGNNPWQLQARAKHGKDYDMHVANLEQQMQHLMTEQNGVNRVAGMTAATDTKAEAATYAADLRAQTAEKSLAEKAQKDASWAEVQRGILGIKKDMEPAQYSALMSSVYSKMANADLSGARTDMAQAQAEVQRKYWWAKSPAGIAAAAALGVPGAQGAQSNVIDQGMARQNKPQLVQTESGPFTYFPRGQNGTGQPMISPVPKNSGIPGVPAGPGGTSVPDGGAAMRLLQTLPPTLNGHRLPSGVPMNIDATQDPLMKDYAMAVSNIPPKRGGQEDKEVQSSITGWQAGKKVLSTIDQLAQKPDDWGAIHGNITKFLQKTGLSQPEVDALGVGSLIVAGQHNASINQRNYKAIDELAKMVNLAKNPESLRATMQTLMGTFQSKISRRPDKIEDAVNAGIPYNELMQIYHPDVYMKNSVDRLRQKVAEDQDAAKQAKYKQATGTVKK